MKNSWITNIASSIPMYCDWSSVDKHFNFFNTSILNIFPWLQFKKSIKIEENLISRNPVCPIKTSPCPVCHNAPLSSPHQGWRWTTGCWSRGLPSLGRSVYQDSCCTRPVFSTPCSTTLYTRTRSVMRSWTLITYPFYHTATRTRL